MRITRLQRKSQLCNGPPVLQLLMHGHLIPRVSAEETGGHFSPLRPEMSYNSPRMLGRENQGKIRSIFLMFSKLEYESNIRERIEALSQTVRIIKMNPENDLLFRHFSSAGLCSGSARSFRLGYGLILVCSSLQTGHKASQCFIVFYKYYKRDSQVIKALLFVPVQTRHPA